MNGSKAVRGQFLLVAIVLTTLLSLVMAAVIQPIQTTRQRQKEQELLYRGEHLAEGIRRFYFQKGRFPFDLEELVDNEPRFVRKLYQDPMTQNGEWNLVYLTPGDKEVVNDLNGLARQLLFGERTEEDNSENQDRDGTGISRTRGAFAINDRQITGVRSKSDTEGFTVRNDSRIYADWLFSALPDRKQTAIKRLQQQIQ